MPNLPQSGLKLVAENVGDFLGDLNKAYNSVDRLMDGLGRAGKAGGIFGEMMTGAMHRVGEIGVDALGDLARAGADFVKDGIGAAGDVEQTLNVLQVAGKATEAQMAAISKRALELGSDLTLPATSAADASTAMLELVKAGFSVDQAMAGAKGTLQLAAAAETDAATAANLMSGALNAFQLEAKDAVHITDILAGAANASQASITDLSQGFNQAGFAFHTIGASADDLAVSLAILTKNGLTGSDAGTALKNAVMRLIDPTDKAAGVMKDLGFSAYDASGVMKPWPQIIGELQSATAGLTPELRNQALGNIFLSDGMKAMIPLMNLSKEQLAGMYTEVTASGQAAELSAARMQGWNGVVEGFNSQMETLGIIIGQKVLPVITPLGQKLNEALGLLGQGDFTGAFARINEVLQEALSQVTTFFQQVGAGTSPISPLLDGIARALQPMGQMLIDTASGWFKNLTDWIMKEAPPFLKPIGAMIVEQAGKWFDQLLVWVDEQVPVLLEKLKLWADQFIAWIEPQIPVLLEKLNPLMDKLETWIEDQIPGLKIKLMEWGDQFGAWVMAEAAPRLLNGLWDLWIKLLNWVADRSIDLRDAGNHMMMGFLLGIGQSILDLPMTLANLATRLVGGIRDMGAWVLHEGGNLGRAIIQGFGQAIQDGVQWIVDQARNMAQAAANAARAALGMNSPSKVFAEIGLNTDKGFAMGLKQGTPMVQSAMASMVAPPAYPQMGGGTSINNSRTINYQPSYGAAVTPNPQRDSAMARTFAL
jgi:TP901 family phage tail tape measure protein